MSIQNTFTEANKNFHNALEALIIASTLVAGVAGFAIALPFLGIALSNGAGLAGAGLTYISLRYMTGTEHNKLTKN